MEIERERERVQMKEEDIISQFIDSQKKNKKLQLQLESDRYEIQRLRQQIVELKSERIGQSKEEIEKLVSEALEARDLKEFKQEQCQIENEVVKQRMKEQEIEKEVRRRVQIIREQEQKEQNSRKKRQLNEYVEVKQFFDEDSSLRTSSQIKAQTCNISFNIQNML
ncbi:MAG: hypothetical protein EZS28_034904 [Streblomastix strix]|uniref:Uncharacterized protein n=1 Tax=Streblomastix strix TaxID=222440 RepID=A0A5J4UHK1_9EUKA|nr:MAG: hypothetical protein EZS28_034904 [Streblomastix strix]